MSVRFVVKPLLVISAVASVILAADMLSPPIVIPVVIPLPPDPVPVPVMVFVPDATAPIAVSKVWDSLNPAARAALKVETID